MRWRLRQDVESHLSEASVPATMVVLGGALIVCSGASLENHIHGNQWKQKSV